MMDLEELKSDLCTAIGYNYEEMVDTWLQLSPEELIEKADDITAANLIYLNARYCVRDDDVPKLLELKNPLQFLIDVWKEGLEGTITWMPDEVYREIDHDALDDYERQDDDPPTMQMG